MAALIFLVCVSSWGQTPLNQLSYSSDITAIFSSTLLQDEKAGECESRRRSKALVRVENVPWQGASDRPDR